MRSAFPPEGGGGNYENRFVTTAKKPCENSENVNNVSYNLVKTCVLI